MRFSVVTVAALGVVGGCGRSAEVAVAMAELHASARPFAGPERDLEPPVYTDHRAIADDPTVGVGGAGALVVWRDNRVDPFMNQGAADLFATRLAVDGTPIDRRGVQLTRTRDAEFQPRLAWNGQIYLLVWQERLSNRFHLRATRVAADGTPLDANGFDLSVRTGNQRDHFVASDGKDFMVVWSDEQPLGNGYSYTIHGTVVRADGSVIRHDGAVLSQGTDTARIPRQLIWNGREYLTLQLSTNQNDGHRLVPLRLGRDGAPIGGPPPALVGGTTWVAGVTAAWTGNRYVLAWAEAAVGPVNPTGYQQKARVLDADGAPLDGIVTELATMTKSPRLAQAVWTGANVLLVWADDDFLAANTFGLRLDANGRPLDSKPVTLNAPFPSLAPAAGWLGDSLYLVLNRAVRWRSSGVDISDGISSADGWPAICSHAIPP